MQSFNSISNGTIYDVCLNTYGNLDLLVKLMVDNGFEGVNVYPENGQEFIYDDSLVLKANKVISKYATRFNNIIDPTNLSNMAYEQILETMYVAAADGETSIIVTDLIGNRIVSVEKEIKPLSAVNYNFNITLGRINLLNGVSMSGGEQLSILYGKMVTL